MKYKCTVYKEGIVFIEVYVDDDIWFEVDECFDTNVYVSKNGYIYEYNLNHDFGSMQDDELFQMSTVISIPFDLKIIREAHKQFSTIIKENSSLLYHYILVTEDE
ncbi:hypothetical protein DIDNDMLP_00215 [Klebsiella phage KP13-7]|nr:hypothetical protein CPT_Muenster_552 [Klebsiella phage Muenster]UYL05200.1 hypothetical protein DIDNDMLP_00215 [Klebsiella phage KP13-7]